MTTEFRDGRTETVVWQPRQRGIALTGLVFAERTQTYEFRPNRTPSRASPTEDAGRALTAERPSEAKPQV